MKKLMLLVVAVSLAAISFGQTKEKNMLTITRADTPQGIGFYLSLTKPADTNVDFGCNLYIFGTNDPQWQSDYYYLRANFSNGVLYDYIQTNIPTDATIMLEVHYISGGSDKYEYELSNEANSYLY